MLARNDPADVLVTIAQRVAALSPDRRDPHRYFEAKGEIVSELRQVAARMTSFFTRQSRPPTRHQRDRCSHRRHQ